jgi:hypothetical protein
MNRILKKTAVVYLGMSILCGIITNVYAIFGHDIRSWYMDLMFLYPFAGGVGLFTGLGIFYPRCVNRVFFRAGYNLYNSGIATLTTTSMLAGVMEIAGTGSRWIRYVAIIGGIFVLAGVITGLAGKEYVINKFITSD